MGINPETYAPSSSPTSVPSDTTVGAAAAAAAAAAPSSSTTRHMAQWESARLEAEARHSRESALFSTSGAASPGHSGASGPAKLDADFFLRMWNSEVGEAFRSKEATSGVSPASSSSKCSSSSAQLTVAVKKEELMEDGKLTSGGSGAGGGSSVSSGEGHDPNKEDVECKSSVSGRAGGGGSGNTADSSSSNEVEEATSEEETYQMYLNLMGDDMAQLGHLFQGGLDSISLFGGDLNEASLDMVAAFK